MSQDRDWCISIFALHVNTLMVRECSQLHLNTVLTILSYHRRSVRRPQNNWSVVLGLGRDWPVPRIFCGVMIWNCVHTTSAFPSFSARENKREATWAHVVFNPLPQEKHLHMIITAAAPRVTRPSDKYSFWRSFYVTSQCLFLKKIHFCEGLSVKMYIWLQIPHTPSPARLQHTLSSLSNENAETMRGRV